MCNAVVLSWLLGCMSQDLFKGQFDSLVDLPSCTCDAALKVKKHSQILRDESHMNSNVTSKYAKYGPTAFTTRIVEQVKQIKSYKLGNNLIIKDVLVVLGYHDLTQKFPMGTGSEKGGLYFLDESRRVNNSNINLRSNDPNDDGGDSAVNGNKSAPKSSDVDEVSKDQVHKQTNNSDTTDISLSSSSRKDTKDPQYATETKVLEGIQGIALNDDEYESTGKDIEYVETVWGGGVNTFTL
nr:ribonuclease H-like domain-containing protein [Tanacetum cinerariifolium]GEZ45930.1 ribonuclease H-like domain-containing protein [Tanacetum cinerariifolium]